MFDVTEWFDSHGVTLVEMFGRAWSLDKGQLVRRYKAKQRQTI
jgi:hypothetical protein